MPKWIKTTARYADPKAAPLPVNAVGTVERDDQEPGHSGKQSEPAQRDDRR